jgi:uncharacterized membrane protein
LIAIIPNWHPLFVHFTVALLIIGVMAHLLTQFFAVGKLHPQLTLVARWNLLLGVGFTLLTVAAGWYAYNTVAHDAPSHSAMTEHRNWAVVTFALFLGIAGWEYYLPRRSAGSGWLFSGVLVIAAGLLLSTAWHGGELVYRYGLGVMSLPQVEGPGHTHEHGEMPLQSEKVPHEHGRDDAVHGAETPKKAGHTHAPGTPQHND